jgi:hypothetical protein
MRYLLAFLLVTVMLPLTDVYQNVKAHTQRDTLPRHPC